MEFRLVYNGDLRPKGKGGQRHVHAVRRALHPQLERLWETPPLSELRQWLEPAGQPGDYSVREEVEGHIFAPLVSTRIDVHAELHVLFLRAGNRRAIIGSDGDLDNRIKTLMDALRMPTKSEARYLAADEGGIGPSPFLCLLRDDDLITKLSVESDRWLSEPIGSQQTLAIIKVRVRPTRATMGNASVAY